MSVFVDFLATSVKSVFEIAVWDKFGTFKAGSGFSVGLELFFAVEAKRSINFSTPIDSDIFFCSKPFFLKCSWTTGFIQDLSPLQDLAVSFIRWRLCARSFQLLSYSPSSDFPTIFEVLLLVVVPRRLLGCSKLCKWINLYFLNFSVNNQSGLLRNSFTYWSKGFEAMKAEK